MLICAFLCITAFSIGIVAGLHRGRQQERERVLGYFYDTLTNYGLISRTANIILRRIKDESDDAKFQQELNLERLERKAKRDGW